MDIEGRNNKRKTIQATAKKTGHCARFRGCTVFELALSSTGGLLYGLSIIFIIDHLRWTAPLVVDSRLHNLSAQTGIAQYLVAGLMAKPQDAA